MLRGMAQKSDTLFEQAFALTVGAEGGFQNDETDRGNWTGGDVGKGQLRGTKFGVSAATYPTLDIQTLTLDQARDIYRRDFWQPLRCDELPRLIAILMFDAGVNNGRGNAVRFLQRALDIADDGVLGPITLAVLKAHGDFWGVAEQMQRERIRLMRKLSTWPRYGGGWAERVAALPCEAAAICTRIDEEKAP